ncbi:MAG: UDP-N-acetylglucosamine 2-epimerase (non-hydrolyzing) [Coriobacteriia bacterium]
MRVLTVLGTRPELIRLSLIIPGLDELVDHVLVHTGQNFDATLSDVFFKELGIRQPDHALNIRGASFGEQVGLMLTAVEGIIQQCRPDALLVLGDTNSGLSAIVAKRAGIPVFHMEAGNRCFDDRVPEEVNRRLIDHASSILMPYTQRSKENLLREGIPCHRIFVTGNPINEVLTHFEAAIDSTDVLDRLGLTAGEFFLVTMHRAETVDSEERLGSLVTALEAIRDTYDRPVLCSLHPRTRDRMARAGMSFEGTGIRYLEPLGLFDFVALEKSARCVLTDSGTVQEECSIFRVPSVTLREVTERPETIEAGSNMLAGVGSGGILRAVSTVLAKPPDWEPPAGYLDTSVSRTVVKILLSEPLLRSDTRPL